MVYYKGIKSCSSHYKSGANSLKPPLRYIINNEREVRSGNGAEGNKIALPKEKNTTFMLNFELREWGIF